jgi:competence protein ComGC
MNIPAQSAQPKDSCAFTVVDLFITITCVALLAVMFLPALARSKARSSRIGCVTYMAQIGLAFRSWSLDNNDHFPMQVPVANGGTMELVASGAVYPHFQVLSNELSTPKILLCPNDGQRSYSTNFTVDLTDNKLSYFLNMDAMNGDGAGLLSGDRNITNKSQVGVRLVSFTKADSIAWTKEIHCEKGHLAFADGRVASFGNGSAGAVIKIDVGTTNWLAVP